ncbi:MAG: hypothetical protein ABIP45_10080 [Knoellia sp.]
MRKIFLVLIGLLLAAFTATSAQAASAHFVKGPSGSVSGNTLTVTFKAAGLGNASETATFSLTGTVTVESQCYTRSGNPVNGVPKSDTVTVNSTETFPVRNGSVTGTFTVSPLSTLTCTGNQTVRTTVTSADLMVSGEGISAPVKF